ncbi:MAG TPA: hypothetical protein VL485_05200 [Ktedonobacteraceae bacterium]|jgi:hypothetical protein|nr:hypothetical protein [Ktedonobacteraceae bacterium]
MASWLQNNALEQERVFIRNTLGNKIIIFWLSYLCFLVGAGSLAGAITTNWYISVGITLLGCGSSCWLWATRVGKWRIFLALGLVACILTFGITALMHRFTYNSSHVDTFWLIQQRVLWVGRQVNFGLIIGSIAATISGLLGVIASETNSSKLGYYFVDTDALLVVLAMGTCLGLIAAWVLWLIVGTLAMFFNWGYGWGSGWYISCFLTLPIGVLACAGLVVAIYITLRWYQPLWLYNIFRK